MNTPQSIMKQLQEMAEQPGAIDASTWLTGAMKLRVLLQNEQERLVDMERRIQQVKLALLEKGKTAAHAKVALESTEQFAEAKKQEVFIKTALDVVLLAKKYATTETDLYKAM